MPALMPTPGLPMEPNGEQRKLVGEAVLAYLDHFEESRRTAPTSVAPPDSELVASLLASPPEEGVGIERLLNVLDHAVDTGFDTSSLGFLSYIPTGGLYASSLGSFLGAGTNQYTGGSHASPGASHLSRALSTG
jgi:aromatic-L-amino-acid decarboxylase